MQINGQENALQWQAIDLSEGVKCLEKFVATFKNEVDAQTFYTKFN